MVSHTSHFAIEGGICWFYLETTSWAFICMGCYPFSFISKSICIVGSIMYFRSPNRISWSLSRLVSHTFHLFSEMPMRKMNRFHLGVFILITDEEELQTLWFLHLITIVTPSTMADWNCTCWWNWNHLPASMHSSTLLN